MEGEVCDRPIFNASLLDSKRMQIDNKGSSRGDIESPDLRAMPQQLSMAQRPNRRWILLNNQNWRLERLF